MRRLSFVIGCVWVVSVSWAKGAEWVRGRSSLVFTNRAARLVVDLAGGSIVEFRRVGNPINPLSWGTPRENDTAVRGFGHFLCLDRWGPPSKAEGDRGMPYHGEAANVSWSVQQEVSNRSGLMEAEMSARLPKAGLSIRRHLAFSSNEAVFLVNEQVTNENALGRLWNMVQHPTVGPPFLDGDTVVDCNGWQGFSQGGSLPNPEEPSTYWPRALTRDGASVDLRRLSDDAEPNVVTYALEEPHGWVTALNRGHRLLLGYVWRASDYPWVSLWRDVQDGKPAARGLEFGTTGLHQPYPVLVQKGRLWGRPLFEYLDAGETVTKRYLGFLIEVPADFGGVESVVLERGRLTVRERTRATPREVSVSVEKGLEL